MARLRNVIIPLTLILLAGIIGARGETTHSPDKEIKTLQKGELLCYVLNQDNYPVYNGHGIIFHGEDGVDRVVCWDQGPFSRMPKDHA